jgi:LacI family transcriptional regulator
MDDVAKLAGVSIATVSRVLNEPEKVKPETRDRVIQIINENNYVTNAVARGLVKNSMKTIGVLLMDVRDLYFANMTYNIERRFTELGYNVILSNTGGELGEKKRYLRVMLEKQVDGLILVGSVFKERSGNTHIIDASKVVPVVMVNSFLEAERIFSIVCNDTQGIFDAASYLVKLGHKSIHYLCDIRSLSGIAKADGFKKAVREYGLTEFSVIEINRSLEGGRSGVRQIIESRKKITAVITGEDITASGAIKELTARGYRVPGDISVIGYNNSILTEVSTPTLTSVNNMIEAMAAGAVKILYDVLQGRQVSKKTTLTPVLVVRDSTDKALT